MRIVQALQYCSHRAARLIPKYLNLFQLIAVIALNELQYQTGGIGPGGTFHDGYQDVQNVQLPDPVSNVGHMFVVYLVLWTITIVVLHSF